ncbi:GvpL/GvpF family gas vesicle protein [Saccharomonospora sp. NPDC006951]
MSTSTFLYGIVSGSHPKKLTGIRGVGRTPGPLRTVAADDLAVVVSDAPSDIRPKRRDVAAHHAALEALCEQGPTLPMRFGVLAGGDDEIAREVAAERDRFGDLLTRIAGRTEMNVKATHDEPAVLRMVLHEDATLLAMNDELRDRSGGDHDSRVRFGEQVAAAVAERERHDSGAIVAALEPFAVEYAEGPALAGTFLNCSFLVERENVEKFRAAAKDIGRVAEGYLDLRTRGPLPPYSFAGVHTGSG